MSLLRSLAPILLLVGCASGDHEDLRQWMQDSTKDMRGNIQKLPEVKPYEPVPYDVENILDPFKVAKIEPESKSKQAMGKFSQFQPDFDARDLRNNLLEKYPLESLKMVGYLNVNRQPIAIIRMDDKTKQVRVGEYIGQDFGMVTKITENEVLLRELVQDSAGDWSERRSSLYLQSAEGGKK